MTQAKTDSVTNQKPNVPHLIPTGEWNEPPPCANTHHRHLLAGIIRTRITVIPP
jgi:hypothetical protein